MALYSLLLMIVLCAGAPFWLARMVTSGRYRAGLAQRLGRVPAQLREAGRRAAAEGRDVIWLHAVSVGEVLAAVALVRELEGVGDATVVVSTTTEAGQRVAHERLAGRPVFYLPLDFGFLVQRYLRVIRPRLLVLMESELWPNLLVCCERAGCAVVVANARISDRSLPRYMRLRRLWRPLLRKVRLFLAQGPETAERLVWIGAEQEGVLVAGNLKFDMAEPKQGAVWRRIRSSLGDRARLLVAGSTLPGEETLLLEAWPAVLMGCPEAALLLAPRHPDRFAAVAAMVEERGWAAVRASEMVDGQRIGERQVLVLDTIGDLGALYSLGSASFIGGTLVPAGGHNPLEAARFGVPVAMGPSVENFREVVAAMNAADAVLRVEAGAALGPALAELLRGGDAAQLMGERGRSVYLAQAGAARRSAEAIMALGVLRASVTR